MAAAGSAGSMSSCQGTIPAAMAPCASTTIAALIAQPSGAGPQVLRR